MLALLALAGLLRPEAWVFSGLYWLYLRLSQDVSVYAGARRGPGAGGISASSLFLSERSHRTHAHARGRAGARARLFGLTLLAFCAPLIWVLSDLAIAHDALWSLTNTRHTAETLHRVTGIRHVPEYIPKRIGEVLGAPVLAAAVLGGVASLLWLRERAMMPALVGLVAVVVFAAFASAGLPIISRYAFLASAILTIFAAAGVFGWLCLEAGDPRRASRGWRSAPSWRWRYSPTGHRSTTPCTGTSQPRAPGRDPERPARAGRRASDHLSCGPVGVPNHAPVPLLALYLKTSPAKIVDGERNRPISRGVYVDPAKQGGRRGLRAR